FHSIYVRTPGGALFEAANSVPQSFFVDESRENLGKEFQLPPWYESRRQELIAALEPIQY
ncbi:MAG: VOC family protein, partial [Terriglobia bacterium]